MTTSAGTATAAGSALNDPGAAPEALRAAGLRVTPLRLAVVAALDAAPHADTDTVRGAVTEQLGTASVQAVYDALAALTGAGLVRRIEPDGSPARFELRVGDNHHHVVCRTCGALADVDCAVGHAPCLAPSHDHGFAIERAEVLFWGTCPSCATAASHPDPARPGAPAC